MVVQTHEASQLPPLDIKRLKRALKTEEYALFWKKLKLFSFFLKFVISFFKGGVLFHICKEIFFWLKQYYYFLKNKIVQSLIT